MRRLFGCLSLAGLVIGLGVIPVYAQTNTPTPTDTPTPTNTATPSSTPTNTPYFYNAVTLPIPTSTGTLTITPTDQPQAAWIYTVDTGESMLVAQGVVEIVLGIFIVFLLLQILRTLKNR